MLVMSQGTEMRSHASTAASQKVARNTLLCCRSHSAVIGRLAELHHFSHIQYSVTLLTQCVTEPPMQDWVATKRTVRYLLETN